MIDHTSLPPVEPDVVPFRNNPRRTVICCSGWRLCTIPGPCHAEAWMLVRADISTLLHQCPSLSCTSPPLPFLLRASFGCPFLLCAIFSIDNAKRTTRLSWCGHYVCSPTTFVLSSSNLPPQIMSQTAKLVPRTRRVLLLRPRAKRNFKKRKIDFIFNESHSTALSCRYAFECRKPQKFSFRTLSPSSSFRSISPRLPAENVKVLMRQG